MSKVTPPYKLVIYGLIDSMNFRRVQNCARQMVIDFPKKFKPPDIISMFEFEWEPFIEEKKKIMRGEMWNYNKNELVYINEKMIGSYDDLVTWTDYNKFYVDTLPFLLFSALVEEDYRQELIKRNHDYIHMYISIDNTPAGCFLIELFNDIVPKTCENFKTLCIGNNPMTLYQNRKLTYDNSIFHRIVPNGWIQGGDVCEGHGNEGDSIYGGEFEDENFVIPFNKRGILGMANYGAHTNASQFFITLVETSWMDRKYVGFGQLLEGTELLQLLEEQETFNERPLKPIRITKCEPFDLKEPIVYTPPSHMDDSLLSDRQDAQRGSRDGAAKGALEDAMGGAAEDAVEGKGDGAPESAEGVQEGAVEGEGNGAPESTEVQEGAVEGERDDAIDGAPESTELQEDAVEGEVKGTHEDAPENATETIEESAPDDA